MTYKDGEPGQYTDYVTSKDRRLDNEAFLDSLWGKTGSHQDPEPVSNDRGTQRIRLWCVLARDVNNTWRGREVRAYTAKHAVSKYRNIFKIYEVVGVVLLGGSGHAIKWYRDGEWNTKPL